MSLDEIKKILYKEKPIAKQYNWGLYMEGAIHYYRTDTSIGRFYFNVPRNEMGDTEFEEELPAQYLIRWLKTN